MNPNFDQPANTSGNGITPADIQAIVQAALSQQAASFEADRKEMEEEIKRLKLSKGQPSRSPKVSMASNSGNVSVVQHKKVKNKISVHSTTTSPSPKQAKTPTKPENKRASIIKESSQKQFRRAQSEPAPNISAPLSTPKAKNGRSPVKPSSSLAKKKPNQMITNDFPPEFKQTKECLFAHICLLWGLLQTGSVPPAANQEYIRSFCANFSSISEFERYAEDSNLAQLISAQDVITLKEARAGQIKVGRNFIHIQEDYISYIHGYLAKVGIRCWGPDLEEGSESLFNAACWIAAINIFRQIAVSGCYDFMNFNCLYKDDLLLLIRAYNHYVHHVMAQKYQAECKQAGKYQESAESKNAQKNCAWLRDLRMKFAVINDFPPRYKKIISEITAHSDDERDPKGNCFAIKTLGYRSNKANIFFRRLDLVMKGVSSATGKTSRMRVRKLPSKPIESKFTKVPKELPVDFYHRKWLLNLPTAQQRIIPDTLQVAFLNDPSLSLLPRNHPKYDKDEKLSDRQFNKKYLEDTLTFYHLNEIVKEPEESSDDEECEEPNEEEIEGGVIDLEVSSPEDSDGFLDDGDWGNQYNSEDDSDYQEDEDNNNEDDDDSEDKDNEFDFEQDNSMQEVWIERLQ